MAVTADDFKIEETEDHAFRISSPLLGESAFIAATREDADAFVEHQIALRSE
jgi:hypothetical protein